MRQYEIVVFLVHDIAAR